MFAYLYIDKEMSENEEDMYNEQLWKFLEDRGLPDEDISRMKEDKVCGYMCMVQDHLGSLQLSRHIAIFCSGHSFL